MKKREYIIIHGLNGSPEGHWQHFLHEDLRERGEKVFFPQFPNNNSPNLELWLKYFDKYKNHIHENTIIIAHSMGVIFWLHFIEKNFNIKIKKCILVAPPSRDFLERHEYTKSFSNFVLDKNLFHRVNKSSLLIATANDEYCIPEAKEAFGLLDIEYYSLPPKAGHINILSGYGKWEKILEIALKS